MTTIRTYPVRALVFAALSTLLVALAGCGGSAPGARLSAAQRAEVRTELARIAHRVAHAAAKPGDQQRGRQTKRDREDWRTAPPRIPGEAGALAASIRTALHGGDWLAPTGEAGASGRASVSFYGHTEVCWAFAGLRGLGRPTGVMIYQGVLTPNARRAGQAVLALSSGFRRRGCETSIPQRVLLLIERQPSRFFLAIADRAYAPAAGGQL
jgi:hypothetical protein